MADPELTPAQRDALLLANVQFQVEVVHLIAALALKAGVAPDDLVGCLRDTAHKATASTRLPFEHWARFLEGAARPDLRLIEGGLSEAER